MREMSHDNINPFVGATVDLPDISYLMAYCPKGSLQVDNYIFYMTLFM